VRAVLGVLALLVAVVLQVTVVDRIAFPGGTGPDLVLLAVAAFALAGGPASGAFTGFLGGLALDVAPPGSHFVGQDALVFCLVGYGCGLLAAPPPGEGSREPHRTALFEIVVMAAGAVCGEALTAALGKLLSDPRVSVPAVRHVLPAAAGYDVLLCPFVLYAAAAVLRLGGAVRPARERPGRAAAAAADVAAAQAAAGAVRQAPAALNGSAPRLRLAARGRGDAWVASRVAAGGRPAGREPRLRLGRGGPPGGSALRHGGLAGGGALGAAFAAGGTAKLRFGQRRGEGVLGGSMLGLLAGPRPGGPAWGRGGAGLGGLLSGDSRLGRSRFGRSRMGRSLLGGSVFSRSPSSALSAPAGQPSPRAAPRFAAARRYRPPGLSRRWGPARTGPRRRPGRHGALARLGAALRRSARGRPSGAAAAGAARRSAPRGSAFRGSGRGALALRRRGLGRSPAAGWPRRRRLLRGVAGGSMPRIGSKLAMGRKAGKPGRARWRRGGLR
jgi:rod shape-determining protein MreD